MPAYKKAVEEPVEAGAMEGFAFAGKIRNFVEKSRVAVQVHLAHLEKAGKDDPLARRVLPALVAIEAIVEGDISAVTRENAVWKNWARRVKGCSPLLLGAIMSRGDIIRMHNVGKVWAHYGFRPGQKLEPGKKIDFDKTGRVWCRRLGDSLLRANGCFKAVFDDRKAYEERQAWVRGQAIVYRMAGSKAALAAEEKKRRVEKGGPVVVRPPSYGINPSTEISALHIHNRTMRYMIKCFLARLYEEWRSAEGLDVVNLYVHDKLGHTTHYPLEKFVDYTVEEADEKGR